MNKVIVIVGPTGVGKTKLSIELAKRLNGEVINADSTQVYKGMNIATAKVTKDEQEGVVHHLFDIKDITEDYTVFDYQKDCREKINDIIKKGSTPILVGGTGLYIKATLFDYEFTDEEKSNNDYSMYTNDELYHKLLEVDPGTEIHKNNRKRVERALDYYDIHKEPLSSKKQANKILYDVIFIGLTTDRDKLYDIINKRVDKMVELGLLNEAKFIYDSNIRTKAVLTPIGYKELFSYFDGINNLDDCLNDIKQNSRRYAKRQYTWFNNQLDVNWFNVNFDNFVETVDTVYNFIINNK